MPSSLRSIAVSVSLASLACGPRARTLTGPRVVITPQGLKQTIQITPAQPAMGDTIAIVSTVVNTYTLVATDVTSRICGLDLEGNLPLTNPFGWCAGYSRHGELAPGDSISGYDRRVVGGFPGNYTLRVRHLLEPDVWVEVPVTVLP